MCQISCLYQKVHNLYEISSYTAGLQQRLPEKRKQLVTATLTSLCFGSPTEQLACSPACVILYHVTGSCKASIRFSMSMHNNTALNLIYSLLAITPNKILFRCELSVKFLFVSNCLYIQNTQPQLAMQCMQCMHSFCVKIFFIAEMNFNVGI